MLKLKYIRQGRRPDKGHKTDSLENQPLTSSSFFPLITPISPPLWPEPHTPHHRLDELDKADRSTSGTDVVISVNTTGM